MRSGEITVICGGREEVHEQLLANEILEKCERLRGKVQLVLIFKHHFGYVITANFN